MKDRLIQHPTVEVSAVVRLSESELAALDALAGYGVDAFLKVFYEKMGKAYMQPFEGGLRSLFEAIRAEVPQLLHNAKRAREAFNQPLRATTTNPFPQPDPDRRDHAEGSKP